MKSAFLVLCATLAAALPLGACSPGVKDIHATTQVTLRLSSEASVKSRADTVRLSLWVKGDAVWRAGSSIEVAVGIDDWPLDVPILPTSSADDNATFEVTIEARSKGTSLLHTRVVARFVADKVVLVSTSLLACPAPDLTCDGESCHGPECTVCTTSGRCERAGVTAADSQIDIAVQDAAASPDAGRASADAAGSASTDSGVQSAGRNADGSVSIDPGDASDGGSSSAGDGSSPDAGAPSDPAPAACPAQNVCDALLYPCLPTKAGYTCQGQLADWHMPDGVAGAKFAQSYTSTGETALDNVTGLEWQLGLPNTYPGCSSRQELDNGVLGIFAEWCSREEAKNYCAQLSRGGHEDWRLPSMIELTSLFDMRNDAHSPNAVVEDFFGDTTSQQFISGSTGAGGPSTNWMVSYEFREIIVFNNLKGRVRCVRGGAVPDYATPADRYLVSADTVTDRATSLVWQRGSSPTKVEETATEAYCTNLGAGYRLPTGNELMTLVDPTRQIPAIDPEAFPNTPSEEFATSTKLVRESSVSFATGMLRVSSAGGLYVRCVRNQ